MKEADLLPPKSRIVIVEPEEGKHDGFWVEYSDNKVTLQSMGEMRKRQDEGDLEGIAQMYLGWDLSWNLQDNDGNDMPVNLKTIMNRPTPILKRIADAIRSDQSPKETS